MAIKPMNGVTNHELRKVIATITFIESYIQLRNFVFIHPILDRTFTFSNKW